MIALILAGGFATRLWPLTKDYPKPLLRLGKRRIIDFALEHLYENEFISRIFISTNTAFRHVFEAWLKESPYCTKAELIFEPSLCEEEKLGAIRGIKYDIEAIADRHGLDDMIIVAGDNAFFMNFSEFIKQFNIKRSPMVAVRKIESIEEAKRFAVVSIDKESKIIEFEEKPRQPKSTLIATAIYALPKDCIGYVSKYLEEGGNPDAPGYFFEWLINKTDVYAFMFEGFWFDIGAPSGFFEALRETLKESYIHRSAVVDGKIVDPVFVGDNVFVSKDSEVGPWVVLENGVRVEEAKISSSLIMERSYIRGSEIRNALIGAHSRIEGSIIKSGILSSYSKLLGHLS